MDKVKKAGIIGGAIAGGLIGGTLSIAGHLAKNKFVDELGESIVDSTILTGSIAGQLASGTTDIIAGGIKKSQEHIERGKADLKSGGGRIVGNYVNNFKQIAGNSGEIIKGAKDGDFKRVLKGTKTLVKIAAIGAITVGAIKVKTDDSEDGGGLEEPTGSEDIGGTL